MSSLPPPPPPDLVDELLSADLDGELGSACHDLGLTAEEADRLLAGTADRRAELGRARGILAQPPVLDELLAARLRTAARRAADPAREVGARRRRLRTMQLIGSAAAVLAVCIGVLAVVRGAGTGSGNVASAPSRTATVPRITGTLDLGEQTGAAAAARAAIGVLAAPPVAPEATGDRAEVAPGPADPAIAPSIAATATPEMAAAAAACSDAARRFAATDAGTALVAGTRLAGVDATVHAFGNRLTVVVVVLDDQCRLLGRTSATLPG